MVVSKVVLQKNKRDLPETTWSGEILFRKRNFCNDSPYDTGFDLASSTTKIGLKIEHSLITSKIFEEKLNFSLFSYNNSAQNFRWYNFTFYRFHLR